MIVVAGSINLDLIANVDRLPAPGETVPGSNFASSPGGKGANQALAARRAGAAVRMVGAVGDDAFAAQALALLDEAGVNLAAVRRVDAPTGTALILVDAAGENMIAVVPGANATVVPDGVAKAGLRRGDHILLQHEIPLETVAAVLALVREADAVSVLNTAPFHAAAADFLHLADYLVANETEFDLYAEALGVSGVDRAARMAGFVQRTGRTLVVTLGKDGLLAAVPGRDIMTVPALPVTPVDTVGAGDTFCGYLAAGLDAGQGLEEALRRAAAAGSLACLKPGAQPAIPMRAEVDAALE